MIQSMVSHSASGDTDGKQVELDNSGNVVVRYVYDAWGGHKVLNGTYGEENVPEIGHKNPLRYRGYYYDTETGLYYLQTRYYDPETGRFINADDILIAASAQSRQINGLNLYAYCMNNPVTNVDPSGHFVITFTSLLLAAIIGFSAGAIAGGIYGGMTAVANGQNVLVGIGLGILTGGLMGAGAGIASLFLAPIIAGGTVVLGVGGATLGTGVALGIGLGISFGSGFVGGIISDLSLQGLGRSDGKLNFKTAVLSGLQWGLLNLAGTFMGSIAGPLATIPTFSLSAFFNFMFGSIGVMIDLLREHI